MRTFQNLPAWRLKQVSLNRRKFHFITNFVLYFYLCCHLLSFSIILERCTFQNKIDYASNSGQVLMGVIKINLYPPPLFLALILLLANEMALFHVIHYLTFGKNRLISTYLNSSQLDWKSLLIKITRKFGIGFNFEIAPFLCKLFDT